MLLTVAVVIFFLASYFFAVRIIIFDHLSWRHNENKIGGGTWAFALGFAAFIPPMVLAIISITTDNAVVRRAFFLPPKIERDRSHGFNLSTVSFRTKVFLGKVFAIGDSKNDFLH